MPSTAHPPARLGEARENCAQIPAFLQTLLAFIATLLGRPRAMARAWHLLPLSAAEPSQCDFGYDNDACGHEYGPTCDGTHMTLEHPALYAIGPGPNRGLRPHPRKALIARPRIARAPPDTPTPIAESPSNRGREPASIIFRYQNKTPAPSHAIVKPSPTHPGPAP